MKNLVILVVVIGMLFSCAGKQKTENLADEIKKISLSDLKSEKGMGVIFLDSAETEWSMFLFNKIGLVDRMLAFNLTPQTFGEVQNLAFDKSEKIYSEMSPNVFIVSYDKMEKKKKLIKEVIIRFNDYLADSHFAIICDFGLSPVTDKLKKFNFQKEDYYFSCYKEDKGNQYFPDVDKKVIEKILSLVMPMYNVEDMAEEDFRFLENLKSEDFLEKVGEMEIK